MNTDAEILQKLENTIAMIAEARGAVSAGETVDLSDIQSRVQVLCESIQATPPDDTEAVEAAIVRMIDDLETLSEELKAHHERLGADVIRKAARSAYQKPEDDD